MSSRLYRLSRRHASGAGDVSRLVFLGAINDRAWLLSFCCPTRYFVRCRCVQEAVFPGDDRRLSSVLAAALGGIDNAIS
jgi:hypothetical protein